MSSIGGIAAAIGCGLLLLLNGVDAAAGVTCGTKEVVIVGAGFSGLGAAKELIDTGGFTADDYVIIEMTNRNGGRVSSVQPANFNGVWIEEGASWLNGEDNPVFELMRQYGKEFTLQNFYDYKIFDYDGNDKVRPAFKATSFVLILTCFRAEFSLLNFLFLLLCRPRMRLD